MWPLVRRFVPLMLLSVVSSVLATGCTTYGTRAHDVILDSDPPGADAYLVTYTAWEKGEGPALLSAWQQASSADDVSAALRDLLGFLADARVQTGRTPVEVKRLVAHEQLFLAVKNGFVAAVRFMPRPEHKGDPRVQLTRHPALAAAP